VRLIKSHEIPLAPMDSSLTDLAARIVALTDCLDGTASKETVALARRAALNAATPPKALLLIRNAALCISSA